MNRGISITLFLSGIMLSSLSVFGALDGDYLNRVKMNLVTPHEAWGRPNARGPLKVLFITSLVGAPRDIVELAQRFDMDWTVFTVIGNTFQGSTPIGSNDEFHRRVQGTSIEAKTAELLDRLEQGADVIVLGNITPDMLPEACRAKLYRMVDAGTGLVRVSYMTEIAPTLPNMTREELDAIGVEDPLPQTPEVSALGDHGATLPAMELVEETPLTRELPPPSAVLNALPYAGLRDFQLRAAGYRRWTTAEPVSVHQIFQNSVRAIQFGAGRVIGLCYEQSATDSYSYRSKAALTAACPDALNTPIQYDYCLRAAAEAILWAAKREARFAVTFTHPEGVSFERAMTDGRTLSFTVSPQNGAPVSFTVLARLRDDLGTVLHDQTVTGGNEPVTVPFVLPQLGTGTHYLEVVVSSPAGYETWAARSFEVVDPQGITSMVIEPQGIPAGQPVMARVTFGAKTDHNLRAEAIVLDAFDRVAALEQMPVAPDQTEHVFEVAYPNPVSAGNTLLMTITDSQGRLGHAYADFFTHRADEFERFPSIIWGGPPGSYTDRLLYRNLRRAAFTSILMGTSVNRCDFTSVPTAIYFQLRATQDGRTLNWLMGPGILDPDTEDASVYNPAVQTEIDRAMKECVDKHAAKGVFVYNLGDENSFSHAGGSGPFEIVAFREFLHDRYNQDLELLNTCWGTAFAAWEDIAPIPLQEAARRKRIAPYVDRCLFNERAYAEIHHYAAERIRALDPDAKIGAEGSQSGDLEKTVSELEFWSPYANRLNNYLQKSVAPNLVSGNWWGGYVGAYVSSRNPVDGGENLWNQVLSGFANSSWWFMLDGVEGMINPDYSFADYFVTGYLPYLREIGDGIGQQINEVTLANSGIYVYYSHPNTHAARVMNYFGNPIQSADAVLAALEKLALSPRIITARQVLAGQLDPEQVKLLVMPTVLMLSDLEVQSIKAYVEAGGHVIADIAPGVINEYGQIRRNDQIDELFGVIRGDVGTLIGPNLTAHLGGHAVGHTGTNHNIHAARFQRPLGEWFAVGYVVDRESQSWQVWQDGMLLETRDISKLGSVSSDRPIGLGFNPGTTGFGGGSEGDFFPWQGAIAEVLIYRAASERQRQEVNAYLAGKYGLGAGNDAPASPPPGAVLWLRADALTMNDGDPVEVWPDSSGNGHDAVGLQPPHETHQMEAMLQAPGLAELPDSSKSGPRLRKNGLNGQPAVVFPGTDTPCGPGHDTNIQDPERVPAFRIEAHPDLQFGSGSFAIYIVAHCELAFTDGTVRPPTFLLGSQPTVRHDGGASAEGFSLVVQAAELATPTALKMNGFQSSGAVVDPTVQARPNRRHQGLADQPLMIENARGQGRTLLMNANLASVRGSLTSESTNAWYAWWRQRTEKAGIMPPATLDGVDARITSFTAPGLTLIGLSQSQRVDAPGSQGVLHLTDDATHIYDVIRGTYLGRRSSVEFDPSERRSRLFALLPAPATPVQLTVADSHLGAAIPCRISFAEPLPLGQRRVLRLAVEDPAGHDRLDLRRYPRLERENHIELAIPIAFNDLPGEWTITVTDIVTGTTAKAVVPVADPHHDVAAPGPWPVPVGLW